MWVCVCVYLYSATSVLSESMHEFPVNTLAHTVQQSSVTSESHSLRRDGITDQPRKERVTIGVMEGVRVKSEE